MKFKIFAIPYVLFSFLFANEQSDAPWEKEHVPVKTDVQIANEINKAPEEKTPEVEEEKQVLKTGVKNRVQGVIISAVDKKPLAKVEVVFDRGDKSFRTLSDEAGIFRIDGINEGTYTISFAKKGYATNKTNSVFVRAIGEVREILLEKKVIQGQKIAVKKPQKAGTDLALRDQRKKSGGVVDAMGAEAISKGTDSDAGSLARRVTGTSVVGGKYVFVRGLGERYTNMTLNGLPVPTPEKDKRVVPQDLFPASALESFAIYKTFSPERIPDFAGGSIALTTKGIPSKDFLKVGIGAGVVDESGGGFTTVGSERLVHDNGSSLVSYFGYGDGFRDRPSVVPTRFPKSQDDETTAYYAYQFNNKWDTDTVTVLPNHDFKIDMGRVYKNGNSKWGMLAGFSHGVKYEGNNEVSYKVSALELQDTTGKIVYDTIPAEEALSGAQEVEQLRKLVRTEIKDYTIGTFKTTQSGLFNLGYEDKDNVLWFKNLYANLSTEKTSITRVQAHPDAQVSDKSIDERFLLEFNSRRILVSQLGGGHWIGASALDSISWATSFGLSMGSTPDKKLYRYKIAHKRDVNITADTLIDGVQYKAGDVYSQYGDIKLTFDKEYGTRYWDEFSEQSYGARLDQYWIVPPEWSQADTVYKEDGFLKNLALPKMTTGQFFNYKSRDFDLYRYGYDRYSGFEQNPEAGYDYINEALNPQSVYDFYLDRRLGFGMTPYGFGAYEANETTIAYYINAEVGATLSGIPMALMGGVRMENYLKNIFIPYTGGDKDPTDPDDQIAIDSLSIRLKSNEFNLYPSVSLAMEWIKDTKLLLAYAQTKVRPELREVVPSSFYDPEESINIVGVESLKDTEIKHYDVRLDWYMPSNQISSLSFFYKNFANPIEVYINTVATPNFKTFQNAKRGYVRGIEIEFDLKVQKMFELFTESAEWAKDLSFYTNAAIIQSDVELDLSSVGAEELTSRSRPMIGQSPWLFNAKLTHEQEVASGDMTNGLLFNVSGKRIKSLGAQGVGDLYELPFPSLDYLFKYSIGSHSYGFKAKNLLYSKKQYAIWDVNKTKSYYKVSDERRDFLYAEIPDKIVQSFEVGMSLSASYSYSF